MIGRQLRDALEMALEDVTERDTTVASLKTELAVALVELDDVRAHVLRVTHRCVEPVTAVDAAGAEVDCTATVCLHPLPCPLHPATRCQRNHDAMASMRIRGEP